MGYGKNHYKQRQNKKRNKKIIIISIFVGIGIFLFSFDFSYSERVENLINSVQKEIPQSVRVVDDIIDYIQKEPLQSIKTIDTPNTPILVSNNEYTITSSPTNLRMDLKPFDGITADFTIKRVYQTDSQYYKIININMLMTTHMELDDMFVFSPTAGWNLKNENGKSYIEKCHGVQYDGKFIYGDQSPNIVWDFCYHVEKEFEKFELYFNTNKIGSIILIR